MKVSITFEIDSDRFEGYSDTHVAALWHLAQANPAPMEDKTAGELAEKIGREIIRRFLASTPPELWNHQAVNHHWAKLHLADSEQKQP